MPSRVLNRSGSWLSSSRNPIVRSRTLSGTSSNERACISSAVSASGRPVAERARRVAVAPEVVDDERAAVSLLHAGDHLPAGEARARDHVVGERPAVIEDHQLVALDDEDADARAAEHDLQLLQHHAQQRLQLQVRRDGVRDLQQRRQLARPLRHLLFQQAQRTLALGHVTHDRQDVHAPAVAESLAPQLEPGQPPVRADAQDARGDDVGGRGPAPGRRRRAADRRNAGTRAGGSVRSCSAL